MANLSGLAMPILVSAALKSTFVLGAAWLVAFALRGRSAAARHLVWTAAAAALLALPLLVGGAAGLAYRTAGAILPVNLGLVFHATGTAVNGPAAAAVPSSPGTGQPAAGAPVRRLDWKTWLMLAVGRGCGHLTRPDAGGLRCHVAGAAPGGSVSRAGPCTGAGGGAGDPARSRGSRNRARQHAHDLRAASPFHLHALRCRFVDRPASVRWFCCMNWRTCGAATWLRT